MHLRNRGSGQWSFIERRKDFADRLNGTPPAALAIDQLLNAVLLMTREDAPSDKGGRDELLSLLEKELRDS